MIRTSQGAAALERELRLSLPPLQLAAVCARGGLGWSGLGDSVFPTVVPDARDPQVESLPWSALTPAGAGLSPQGGFHSAGSPPNLPHTHLLP